MEFNHKHTKGIRLGCFLLFLFTSCTSLSPKIFMDTDGKPYGKAEFLPGECRTDADNSFLFCKNDEVSYHFVLREKIIDYEIELDVDAETSTEKKPPKPLLVLPSYDPIVITFNKTIIHRGLSIVISLQDIKIKQFERKISSLDDFVEYSVPGFLGIH